MKRATPLLLLAVLLLGLPGRAQTRSATDDEPVRFTTLDVVIDPRGIPLAAYQIEFIADSQRVTLVGIEGGEHPAFVEPPYYDPAALSRNRVILAAFNIAAELPAQQTRVARLHLRVTGTAEPEYSTNLQVAADSEGRAISANVSLVKE